MKKHMQKILCLIISLMICFSFSFGCGESTPEPNPDENNTHEHEYGEWVDTSTCLNIGVKTRTCSCGKTEIEDGEIQPHKFADNISCHARYCTICNYVSLPTVKHTGEIGKNCSVCNEKIQETYVIDSEVWYSLENKKLFADGLDYSKITKATQTVTYGYVPHIYGDDRKDGLVTYDVEVEGNTFKNVVDPIYRKAYFGYVRPTTLELELDFTTILFSDLKCYTLVIENGEQLKRFRAVEPTTNESGVKENHYTQGYFILRNDINAKGVRMEHQINKVSYDESNETDGLTYNNRLWDKGFTGYFDGNGYTIKNFATGDHGLFGVIHFAEKKSQYTPADNSPWARAVICNVAFTNVISEGPLFATASTEANRGIITYDDNDNPVLEPSGNLVMRGVNQFINIYVEYKYGTQRPMGLVRMLPYQSRFKNIVIKLEGTKKPLENLFVGEYGVLFSNLQLMFSNSSCKYLVRSSAGSEHIVPYNNLNDIIVFSETWLSRFKRTEMTKTGKSNYKGYAENAMIESPINPEYLEPVTDYFGQNFSGVDEDLDSKATELSGDRGFGVAVLYGVKQFASEKECAFAETDLSSFNNEWWDISKGYPIWKTLM